MSDLTIHSRKAWNAAPRAGVISIRPLKSIEELFIHWPGDKPRSWRHLNTDKEERAAIKGIQNQHINGNDWSDIGYSHVLVPNYGRPDNVPNIYIARGIEYVPAAQMDHNAGTVAILVLMGPDDELLDSVPRRLRAYRRWVEEVTGNRVRVRGHGEVFATECPGPKLRALVKRGLR